MAGWVEDREGESPQRSVLFATYSHRPDAEAICGDHGWPHDDAVGGQPACAGAHLMTALWVQVRKDYFDSLRQAAT